MKLQKTAALDSFWCISSPLTFYQVTGYSRRGIPLLKTLQSTKIDNWVKPCGPLSEKTYQPQWSRKYQCFTIQECPIQKAFVNEMYQYVHLDSK